MLSPMNTAATLNRRNLVVIDNAWRGQDVRTDLGMVRTTTEDGEHRIYRFNASGFVLVWGARFSTVNSAYEAALAAAYAEIERVR